MSEGRIGASQAGIELQCETEIVQDAKVRQETRQGGTINQDVLDQYFNDMARKKRQKRTKKRKQREQWGFGRETRSGLDRRLPTDVLFEGT